MAKISSNRLIKKYGKTNLRAGKYQLLMNEVIANNSESINRAILRISKDNYTKALKKIETKQKPFIMPSIESVLPKRSVFMLKSAEKGRFIVDTLKDRLTKDLRQSIETWAKRPFSGWQLKSRKDKLDTRIIDLFEKNIRTTFEGYTKKDPKYGVPSNIHNIAVTEVRSNIDQIKYQYTDQLLLQNDNLQAWKRWRHNPRLSKKYRRGHHEANGQKVKMNEDFVINTYKIIRGREVFSGVVRCSHPHDQRMGPGEVIGCNCEYTILIRKKRGT